VLRTCLRQELCLIKLPCLAKTLSVPEINNVAQFPQFKIWYDYGCPSPKCYPSRMRFKSGIFKKDETEGALPR
jgi:hypothetical protein